MVTESQIILIDAGNTSIKYVGLDAVKTSLHTANSAKSCVQALRQYPRIACIYLANVGDQSIEDQFRTFCNEIGTTFRLIETQKEQFSLLNAYSDVSKMGVDRWLAMLAAHEMTTQPFAVIDIGTAITCDFVKDGQHLGGWITPGYGIMRDALVKNTARVSANSEIPTQFQPGTDTEECVAMGCQAAVRGVYLSAVDYLSSNQTDFSVIIGGGGKNMLAFAQFDGSILVANLVVHGLARYARNDFPALVSE